MLRFRARKLSYLLSRCGWICLIVAIWASGVQASAAAQHSQTFRSVLTLFFLILGVVSAIRLFSPPTPLLFLFSRSHLLIVSRRLFFVFSFLLCPPLLSIRSADHRHTQHMATVREGKIYYEFVSPFGALASTFGRPRRPRQPPAKQELQQAFVKKSVQKL